MTTYSSLQKKYSQKICPDSWFNIPKALDNLSDIRIYKKLKTKYQKNNSKVYFNINNGLTILLKWNQNKKNTSEHHRVIIIISKYDSQENLPKINAQNRFENKDGKNCYKNY